MENHGFPWSGYVKTMFFHGLPWFSMVFHGTVLHGLRGPWKTMVFHRKPWFPMVRLCEEHGKPWFSMVLFSWV